MNKKEEQKTKEFMLDLVKGLQSGKYVFGFSSKEQVKEHISNHMLKKLGLEVTETEKNVQVGFKKEKNK